MRTLIQKILNESEWYDDLLQSVDNLPFEISSTPTNKPKLANVFKMKTGWEYGDSYLREEFVFHVYDEKEYETFVNVCKFYSKLLDYQEYDRWQDVSKLVKNIGLSLGSYDDEDAYGTPKDMSDFMFGSDFPAHLDSVDISYFDKGGVEYEVKLK